MYLKKKKKEFLYSSSALTGCFALTFSGKPDHPLEYCPWSGYLS